MKGFLMVVGAVGTSIDVTGTSLTLDEIIAVAREGKKVAIGHSGLERIKRGRQILEDAIARGERIYGATTSVGPKTSSPISQANVGEFNRRLLRTHNAGHGPLANRDAVRATMLVLLNSVVSGRTGVRPLVAEVIVEALNSDRPVKMHVWGSMGQSDMSSMSDIALDLFADIELAAGEALALLNSSAMSTGMAALTLIDLGRLLRFSTLVSALSMEGYAANPSIVSAIALESRPLKGLRIQGEAIRRYINGSYILSKDGPRNLQDPLCFRSLPMIQGVAHDNLAFAGGQIERELNASQGNPVISIEEGSLAAVANFDMVSLCMALDVMRLGFAPLVTSSTERVAKLVDTTWSGLAPSLIEEDGVGAPGFNGAALFHKSIASEARLLTAPVVGELASSSHSNGVMDRASLAALSARRSAELYIIGKSAIAMELMVAAQAVELRGRLPLGGTTQLLLAFVRQAVPFAAAGQSAPNVQPLLEHIEKFTRLLDDLMLK
ncbi:histidine ammonia-lyase [Mesorhizobium soli]|uniref:aromatic amino acid ammonia-lyase n=1 Tax=Pseudaminobacter soli (ex Li et al. 2025) TaxID=1295366 RepID=UPI002473DE0B|nr:aromatic amino acid ammonia-lyase [Mesorhizobium soli]MDH6232211.1 histidine ammonia-lyase [Mesorhizobium soli]